MEFSRYFALQACAAIAALLCGVSVSAAPFSEAPATAGAVSELIELHVDIARIEPDTARRSALDLQDPQQDPARQPVLTGTLQGPPAPGQEYGPPPRDKRWKTPTDLILMEIAYQAANAVDAYQSVHCVKSDYCNERNPIFGKNPSTAKIIGLKAASGALHYFAIRELAKHSKTLARIVSIVTLAGQGYVVGYNTTQHF